MTEPIIDADEPIEPKLRDIAVYPNPVVLKKAEPVGVIDREIKQLVADMLLTLTTAGGVGLAAPQVGVSKRVILFVPPVWPHVPVALINPVITTSSGKQKMIEGCLSVAGFEAEVERASYVTVSALTPDGVRVEIKADERLATILQHEIDHLDGVLFFLRLGLSKLKVDLLKGKLKAAQRAARTA